MDPAWRPRVVFAARSLCVGPWRWHNPDGFRACANLWVIADGQGAWRDGHQSYRCAAGDVFVQRLWRECEGTSPRGRALDVLWANIGWRDARGVDLDLRAVEERLPAVHRRVEDPAFVAGCARRMIAAFERGAADVADRWLACALDEADRGARVAADAAVAELIDRVRRDPARPWRVAGLARAARLPVDAFARRFRAATGMAPRTFLVRARLDAAKAQLRMSDRAIGAIADGLGFCDIFHFSRRFRAHVGCSPSAYRAGAGG